jgi:hypothetical protein
LGVGVFGALAIAATALAAPPGTPIANRGEVRFTGSAGPTTVYSNQVALVVAPPPSRAAVTLLRADSSSGSPAIAHPTQCLINGMPTPLPPPYGSDGQVFALGAPLPLGAAATVHGGEAVFVDLFDTDRNRDAQVVDTVEIDFSAAGGDRETSCFGKQPSTRAVSRATCKRRRRPWRSATACRNATRTFAQYATARRDRWRRPRRSSIRSASCSTRRPERASTVLA